MKKKVLVTGAGGFLGSYLVRALSGEGCRVTGTCLGGKPEKFQSGIRYVHLNLAHFQGVSALIRKVRPDWVFHLAGQTIPRLSWKNIAGTFQANTQGTLNLLEALRRHAPEARLLLASTIQVYGRTFRRRKNVAENDLVWPESPYAASKALAEYAVLDYGRRFHLKTVIARFTNSLGRGQSPKLVFPDWCRQVARAEAGGPALLEVGNLDAWRDFLHAGDTIRAMLVLMKKGRAGQAYNVSSGRVRLLKDYVRFLAGQSARPLRIMARRERFRRSDPYRICASADKIKRLGWRPEHSVKEAIRDILAEWREKEKSQKSKVKSRKPSNKK